MAYMKKNGYIKSVPNSATYVSPIIGSLSELVEFLEKKLQAQQAPGGSPGAPAKGQREGSADAADAADAGRSKEVQMAEVLKSLAGPEGFGVRQEGGAEEGGAEAAQVQPKVWAPKNEQEAQELNALVDTMQKQSISRWSAARQKRAVCVVFGVLQAHQGGLTRKQLRDGAALCGTARWTAKDTGLLDYVIKSMVRQQLVGYWIRRSNSPPLGQMVYFLKKATAAECALYRAKSQSQVSSGSQQAGEGYPGGAGTSVGLSPMMQANLSALKSAHTQAHAAAAAKAHHQAAAKNAPKGLAGGRQKQSGKTAQVPVPHLAGGALWQMQQPLQQGHLHPHHQPQHAVALHHAMAMQGLVSQAGMQQAGMQSIPHLNAALGAYSQAMASGQSAALNALQYQALAQQGGGLEARGLLAGSARGLSGLQQAPGAAADPMVSAQSMFQRQPLEVLAAKARLSGGLLGNRSAGAVGAQEDAASPHLLQTLLLKGAQQRGAAAQVPQGVAGQLGLQPTPAQILKWQQQQHEHLLQGTPPGQLAQQLGAQQQREQQARLTAQAQLTEGSKGLAAGPGPGALLDQAKGAAATGRGGSQMYAGGSALALGQADPPRLSQKRSLLEGRSAPYKKRSKQAQKHPVQASQQVPGRANLGLAAQLQVRDAVGGANRGGLGLNVQDPFRQQLQAAGSSTPGASGLSEEALQNLVAERQLAVAMGAGSGVQTAMGALQTDSRSDAALQNVYNIQTMHERNAMVASLGAGAGAGPGVQAPAGLNFGTLLSNGLLGNAGMSPQLQEAHLLQQHALVAGSDGAVPRHGAALNLAASLQGGLPRGHLSADAGLQDLLLKNEAYRFKNQNK